jgi:hypothetical protein
MCRLKQVNEMMSIFRLLLPFAAILTFYGSMIAQAQAFSPANGKAIATFLLPASKYFKHALPAEKIEQFARIAMRPGGTKVVRDEIGKMNLPEEVIEDTFARILVFQNRVERTEADGWMRRLSGAPGFKGAMSKSMGASEANTIGHLNEVRIADSAAQANFRVHGIGVRFKDPNKKGDTDIDVLLERNSKLFAIEAKAYPADAAMPMDTFRADLLTLAEFRKANPQKQVIPVFAITNKPANPDVWKLLEHAAKGHGVEPLAGSADDVVLQLPLLLR